MRWLNNNLKWQAVLTACAAAGFIAMAYALAPSAAQQAVRIGYIYSHESGHLLGAALNGRDWIALEIGTDSGHVITCGEPARVTTILLGPLLPAIIAASLLFAATVQRGVDILLPLLGLGALAAAMFGGPYEQAVDWTLYAIASFGALALMPVAPWVRSILGYIVGMALTIGTIQAAKHFGREGHNPDRPSDAYQLAEQMTSGDPALVLTDARAIVLGLIVMAFLVSLILAVNYLLQNERTI